MERFLYEDKNTQIILDAWKELGLKEVDYNSGNQIGMSRVQLTSIHGTRLSTNGAFIRPIRGRRPNLTIMPNAKVTKIIIDRCNKRAVGVEYLRINSTVRRRAYVRKEVIVSAGTVDSPKLLMLSGIGPAHDLKEANIRVFKDLQVGKNLHDHAYVSLVVESGQLSTLTSIQNMQNDVIYWLNTHEGPLASIGLSDTTAFFRTSYENRPSVPDIQLGLYGFVSEMSNASSNFSFYPLVYYDVFTLSVVLLSPKSRGFLKLNTTNPEDSQPDIHINYLSDPQDIKVLVEALGILDNITETRAFRENGFRKVRFPVLEECEEFELDSPEYLSCFVQLTYGVGTHCVGSCKMGPKNDSNAVVDQKLKVYGIKGLRVIDASIMPVITKGNTNAPTIMIAEKGSDMIKDEWL